VHAPPSPYGDVLRDTKIVLVEPEYKAPR
jgi:hypothetical protein